MIRAIAVGVLAALVGGCVGGPRPVDVASMPDPELTKIATAFDREVERLASADDAVWHTGWGGNIIVNALGNAAGSAHIGLCHEWRDAVYRGVVFDVRRAGWNCGGIVINRGTRQEHHAVLVARPDLGTDALLPVPPTAGAYVLDAWRRGSADIYRLADWIELPLLIETPPELIDMRDQLGGNTHTIAR
ncbi:MAG: hypothetical protein AAGA55_02395 [Planctomycetota bacterium]